VVQAGKGELLAEHGQIRLRVRVSKAVHDPTVWVGASALIGTLYADWICAGVSPLGPDPTPRGPLDAVRYRAKQVAIGRAPVRRRPDRAVDGPRAWASHGGWRSQTAT